ncbi:hypothetical protein MBLNU459_g3818t1 [Dothideomycetes sp. NU459]
MPTMIIRFHSGLREALVKRFGGHTRDDDNSTDPSLVTPVPQVDLIEEEPGEGANNRRGFYDTLGDTWFRRYARVEDLMETSHPKGGELSQPIVNTEPLQEQSQPAADGEPSSEKPQSAERTHALYLAAAPLVPDPNLERADFQFSQESRQLNEPYEQLPGALIPTNDFGPYEPDDGRPSQGSIVLFSSSSNPHQFHKEQSSDRSKSVLWGNCDPQRLDVDPTSNTAFAKGPMNPMMYAALPLGLAP